MHFLGEVARDKDKTLARLHRGARKTDARHLAFDKRRYRHRHGEVRLARARGPDGYHEIVPANGIEIPLLIQRFRRDLLAPRRHGDGLGEQSLHIGGWLRRRHPKRRPNLGGSQRRSLPEHLDEVAQHSFRLRHLSLIASKRYVVPTRGDAHVVSRFEGPQVLVVPAEESEVIEIWRENDPARRVSRLSQRRLLPPF